MTRKAKKINHCPIAGGGTCHHRRTDRGVGEGGLGGGADDSWWEIAAKDSSPGWAYAVNRVYYGKGGNVVFNMQLDRKTDKSTAEDVGKLYANATRLTPPDWATGVSYVFVEDGTGTHTFTSPT